MFERVFTATDMLTACDAAVITALEIAQQNNGKLFVLHVLEPSYFHECGPMESVKDFKTGHETSATKQYKDLVKQVYEIPPSVDVIDYEGKTNLVSFYEKLTRIDNCMGICLMTSATENPLLPGFPEISELYSAATGWETTVDDLKRTGTRILNVEKAFNLLHTNFDRKDDYPTRRDLEEAIPAGSRKGWKYDRQKWDNLLDEYYEMHNWNKQTSYPTRACLEELDLKQVADELEKHDKLGNPNT